MEVENVAVAVWTDVMERTHAPVPEQSPLHPENMEPEAGVAARVTEVPEA
jgi:hypothetical protein